MVRVDRTYLGKTSIEAMESSRDPLQQHRHIVRCFMHKLAQVVVQSRYGTKQPCTNDKTRDWEIVGSDMELQHVAGVADSKFHLDLLDNVEISEQFDHLLGDWYITPGQTFTVQILFQTHDNELVAVEMWSLALTQSSSTAISRHNDTTQLYAKLAALLKSVMVATRIAPGYELSLHQSPSNYIMVYTFTTTPPNTRHLGNNFQTRLFPPVVCTEGQYRLEVRYRTDFERGEDFNCSIVHRDVYYSSLASLTDNAQAPTSGLARQYSSERQLNVHQSPQDVKGSYSAGKQPLASRMSGDTRTGRGSGVSRQLYQQMPGHPLSPSRRVSVATCAARSRDPTPQHDVVCSSLPTRISSLPHPCSSPLQPRKDSSPTRYSPPNLPKSPPTDIPSRPQQSPFSGLSSAPPPDAFIVPPVSLPPGDLFASVVHGPSDPMGTSYQASDEEDPDDSTTTPPDDLSACGSYGDAAIVPGKGSTGSAGDRADPDFVLVDNPPSFMDNPSPKCELGVFYYACKNAPRLFTSSSTGDVAQGSSAGSGGRTDAASSSPSSGGGMSLTPQRGGGRVVKGHVDQDELFSQGKVASFGAQVLLQKETEKKPEEATRKISDIQAPPNSVLHRLKQFEDNLDLFNSLVESMHCSTDQDPSQL